MSINSYASLTSSLSDWLNSAGYSGKAQEFISLAEAHFNRTIRHPAMEVTATSATVASQTDYALPSDFMEARMVYLDGSPDRALVAMSPMNLVANYPFSTAGTPGAYAIVGTNLRLAPPPTSSGTLTLHYYQSIPALTATSISNWLVLKHPDLYLRAARFYAYDYMRDEAAADRELARVSEIIASINSAANKMRAPAGPLSMRPATSE